MTNNKMVA